MVTPCYVYRQKCSKIAEKCSKIAFYVNLLTLHAIH